VHFPAIRVVPIGKNQCPIICIKQVFLAPVIINIAWLLHRSPWILPIPGTSSLKHFEENIKAAAIQLTEEDMQFLD
jgi:pyridoxine 4-dehydrogenase